MTEPGEHHLTHAILKTKQRDIRRVFRRCCVHPRPSPGQAKAALPEADVLIDMRICPPVRLDKSPEQADFQDTLPLPLPFAMLAGVQNGMSGSSPSLGGEAVEAGTTPSWGARRLAPCCNVPQRPCRNATGS